MISLPAVRQAFETRLAALIPAWPIAWQAVKFTAEYPNKHLRSNLLPGQPSSPTVFSTGPSQGSGVYQVLVYSAPEGGPKIGDDQAQAIVAHFPRGLQLGSGGLQLWVTDEAGPNPELYDGPWRVVPVSVPYACLG